MIKIQFFKDIFLITLKFGIRHAFNRYRDWRLVKKENKRKNKLYNQLKPEGAIIKDILGNKMRLNMNDYGIHRDLFLDGLREPIATKHIMKTLTKNDLALEIGANIGYYALIESKLCKKVYAVEPISENIYNLKTNVKLNNCKNVEIFQLAFGDKRGEQTMYISSKSNWHSFYQTKNSINKINLKIDTVDNFLENKEKPTFARMDIEGYELKVIQGMNNTLKELKRLFIELHADLISLKETRTIINILEKANFYPELIIKYDRPKFSKILPNNYIDNIYKGDKGTYEIFFLKKQS